MKNQCILCWRQCSQLGFHGHTQKTKQLESDQQSVSCCFCTSCKKNFQASLIFASVSSRSPSGKIGLQCSLNTFHADTFEWLQKNDVVSQPVKAWNGKRAGRLIALMSKNRLFLCSSHHKLVLGILCRRMGYNIRTSVSFADTTTAELSTMETNLVSASLYELRAEKRHQRCGLQTVLLFFKLTLSFGAFAIICVDINLAKSAMFSGSTRKFGQLCGRGTLPQ